MDSFPDDQDPAVALTGYLVKSPPIGNVRKTNFRRWHQRFFVLHEDVKLLHYYTDSSLKVRKGTIDLNTCWQVNDDVPHPKYEYIFSVAVPSRKYYLVAGSSVQKYEWVNRLKEIIRQPIVRKRSKSKFRSASAPEQPESTGVRAEDEEEESSYGFGEMTRSNTAPSARNSIRSIDSCHHLINTSSSPFLLYPCTFHDEVVWLRLCYPNLTLLDQPEGQVLYEWPLDHLRGYGQTGKSFRLEVGSKSPDTEGIWTLELMDDHNVPKDIDDAVARQTSATTARIGESTPSSKAERQNYIQLNFNHLDAEFNVDEDEEGFDDYDYEESSDSSSEDEREEQRSSGKSSDTASAQSTPRKSSSEVIYADVSEIRTMALHRALQGKGSYTAGGGFRQTRHGSSIGLDKSPSVHRAQQAAKKRVQEFRSLPEHEDTSHSASGTVDALLEEIDDLCDQVDSMTTSHRVNPYEEVILHFK